MATPGESTYADLAAVVARASLTSATGYAAWRQEMAPTETAGTKRKRASGPPTRPDVSYSGKGWCCWRQFLGGGAAHGNQCAWHTAASECAWKVHTDRAKKLAFVELRERVQQSGIDGHESYTAECATRGMPCRPERVYRSHGWCCWEHFTDRQFVGRCGHAVTPYVAAQASVAAAQLRSMATYSRWRAANGHAELPADPTAAYAGRGWCCFECFAKRACTRATAT